MTKRRSPDTTTVEHQPPSIDTTRPHSPALLVAFPQPVALAIPRLGESVGRAWLAEKGVVDPEISGSHISFVRAGSQIAVLDDRSRNGTFVDGERLAPGESVTLVDGAILRLGRTLMVYREAPAKLEAAASIGRMVGPWGLTSLRRSLGSLHAHGARNVIIEGETGTGKELVAEAVAVALRRRAKLGVVNMAAVASGVFEAQLFGWRKGAYSGSAEGGPGILASHDGGAVFLDELGELPLDLQPKLLRLLESREVQSVGAPKPTTVDVAIIAASNRDLDAMVAAGTFRRDLLARFDRRIKLPALRDRAEDIYAIASALASLRKAPLDPAKVEIEAVERLTLHDWASNVRELDAFLATLDPPGALPLRAVEQVFGRTTQTRAAPLTKEVVERALEAANGNQVAAARKLGIPRGRLLRILKKLG